MRLFRVRPPATTATKTHRLKMQALLQASAQIEAFRAGSLKDTIAKIETKLQGAQKANTTTTLAESGITLELILAALLIKRHSSQINEVIHALGLLLALPSILEDGEKVESLSLAAGNTGKGFDLETNKRIAEFTFIQWQGGPEVIRQNKIFKDFFFLAEAGTNKRRELYTIGVEYPSKFFNSGRALTPIIDGNRKLGEAFRAKYGNTIPRVQDYYTPRQHLVALRDITQHVPLLATEPTDQDDSTGEA